MLDFSQLPDVSALHPEFTELGERDYAAHMKAREDALHEVFGPSHPDDSILSPRDPNLMINWPGGGVYQFPPRDKRSSWHYVTSGLAQPVSSSETPQLAEGEERFSGFGIELVISTPSEANWAPDVLINLVKYMLFQKSSRVILPGHRIPCNGPLVLDTDTELTHLVATNSREYDTEIMLPAGHRWLNCFVPSPTRDGRRVCFGSWPRMPDDEPRIRQQLETHPRRVQKAMGRSMTFAPLPLLAEFF
jgi:hypothetical protein